MHRVIAPFLLLLSTVGMAQYPVACYPFTDGSGADATGNGFEGMVVGATTTVDRLGAAGDALDFNGTTDHVDIGPFGDLIPADEFSVSCWLKADGSNSDAVILTVPDDVNDRLCISPHYNHNGGNTVFWDYGDIFNDGRTAIIPYALSTAWDHWVFVHSAVENRMAIHVNGVLVLEEAHHSAIVDRTRPVRIGGGPASNGADFFFHGAIDDVQFYAAALSAQAVSDLYASQVASWTCSLVGLPEGDAALPASCYWNGNEVVVQWTDGGHTGSLELLDVEGRQLVNMSGSGDRWILPRTGALPGVYLVRCTVNGHARVGRVVVD